MNAMLSKGQIAMNANNGAESHLDGVEIDDSENCYCGRCPECRVALKVHHRMMCDVERQARVGVAEERGLSLSRNKRATTYRGKSRYLPE